MDTASGYQAESATVERFFQWGKRSGGINYQVCLLCVKVNQGGYLGIDFCKGLILETFEFAHNGKEYKDLSSERQGQMSVRCPWSAVRGGMEHGVRITNLEIFSWIVTPDSYLLAFQNRLDKGAELE